MGRGGHASRARLQAVALGLGLATVATLGSPYPAAAVTGDAADAQVGGLGRAAGQLLVDGADVPATELGASCLAGAGDDWLAGQLIISGVVQSELETAIDLSAAGSLGGVFVLGSPGESVALTLSELRAAGVSSGGVAPFVSVDEEGGRVQRLADLLGPLPAARSLTDGSPVDAAAEVGAHAAQVAALGFTSGLAPVVDVGAGPAIGDRSYADDAATVVEFAGPIVEALLGAGLVPVIKHFPGHGRASADSHVSVAVTPPLDELRDVDLVPYEALVDIEGVAVMVGHLQVPGLTGDLPASLSPEAVTGLLRGELGFDGLVLSDALGMAAVSARWSADEAAVLSLAAGIDLVLIDRIEDVEAVGSSIVAALANGRLDRAEVTASVSRALVARGRSGCAVAAALGLPPA
ncbi:MAG: glycoside hydrolase family 3 N-terminal domain-containing protein [Actinomycetota bacterium]